MPDRSSRRPLIAAAVLVALAAGAALAVLLTSDGEQEPAAPPAETQARTADTETDATETSARTETAERRSADTPAARREARGIERTVTGLLEAAEQNDGPRFCRLLGRPGSDVQQCAAARGIDPAALPTSDELSIERVDVAGRRATVLLVGGTRILLRRSGGRWIVSWVRPPGAGHP